MDMRSESDLPAPQDEHNAPILADACIEGLGRGPSRLECDSRGWLNGFFCPFHDDRRTPNLGIHEEGKRFTCLACGAYGPLYQLAWKLQVGIEAVYRFDNGGSIVRFVDKVIRPCRPDGNGTVVWNWRGLPRHLYRIDEAVAGDLRLFILIVEGMKDVDTAFSAPELKAKDGRSIRATSNPFGAREPWRAEYSEPLRGRRVCIIPDPDDAGRQHARKVATALQGVAAEIRIVELGADLTDWVAAGGTYEKLNEALRKTAPLGSVPDLQAAAQDDRRQRLTYPPSGAWPDPPAPEAYHGLAGEIVRAIEPHTESDPAALLATLLVSFGAAVGDKPHATVEGSKHPPRLFAVLVGPTSKGRKGTAWQQVESLTQSVWVETGGLSPALEWAPVTSGLSSGEGLIWAVRDKITKRSPVKEKGGRIVDYQEEEVDAGVTDKRLLVFEPEFARTLKVMGRDANPLSAIIRQAWDRGDLRVMNRNVPYRATGAHICIAGNITKEELLRYLDTTETGGGFANRFLWIAVRRSKVLPEGGAVPMLSALAKRLRAAQAFAVEVDTVERDEEARRLWAEVYPELSEGKAGLVGAVTSRAEAQVLR